MPSTVNNEQMLESSTPPDGATIAKCHVDRVYSFYPVRDKIDAWNAVTGHRTV